MLDLVVIGAGLAGLRAALDGQAHGLALRCLEAGPRAGGRAGSDRIGDYVLERGPHTFLGSATALRGLIDDLALADAIVPSAGPGWRWVWARGGAHRLPSAPLGLLGLGALSLPGRLRVLAEPLIRSGAPTEEEDLLSFFSRRIGREAARTLVGAFVRGVYATEPELLEAASAMPKAASWEREHGSLLRGAMASRRQGPSHPRGQFGLAGGLGRIGEAAQAALGDALQLDTPVRSLARTAHGWSIETDSEQLHARAVVLATPPEVAARLLGTAAPELAAELTPIPGSPLALVQLGGSGGTPPQGFGLLVPAAHQPEGSCTMGVLYVHSLFPDRAPRDGWLMSCFLGGDALAEDDQAMVLRARRELARLCGLDAAPEVSRVIRYPRAIPRYAPGHSARVRRVRALLNTTPGLALAGNYLDGVSMDAAVQSGRDATLQLLPQLQHLPLEGAA